MKIVFYTPINKQSGGNLVMKIYAEFLVKNGHEVYIIAGAKEDKRYEDNGVKYIIFNKYLNNYIGNFLFLLPYINNYFKLTPQCDVIIPIFFPLVIHALYAKFKHKCQKVIALFQDHKGMFWFGRYIYFLLKIKWLVSKIDEIIAVSHPTAEEIKNISKKNPIVIPNAIDKNYFYKRDLEKENYILFVGSGKEKGLYVFLKAVNRIFKTIPDVKIKIVGPTIDSTNNNIEFLSYTYDKNILAELYSKALVYVNQSPSDSFGLPSLEAMASGTAVVLTDTVGSREFARNQENALIVPVNDAKATAKAIIELINNNDLRQKLIQNGLQTIDKYDWDFSCSKFIEIISKTNINLEDKEKMLKYVR